jgi:hypothetical protein
VPAAHFVPAPRIGPAERVLRPDAREAFR